MRRRPARPLRAALLAAFLVLPLAAPAQQAPAPAQSPVLTLDQERLFATSLWGKRITAEIESASADLAAENRRIEAELTAEEKSLTDRRAEMEPAEFRAAADAFDARVVAIRDTQDSKARDLAQRRDTESQQFFQAVVPVLAQVLRDRGAVVILDNRAIFVAADSIDVTDLLVTEIDTRVGDGLSAPPDQQPDPAQPDPAQPDPAP